MAAESTVEEDSSAESEKASTEEPEETVSDFETTLEEVDTEDLDLTTISAPAPSQEVEELVGKPDLWEVKRAFQIDFLVSRGLKKHHRLLDVGAGTLRGGVPIIDYLEAGHYVGVESRFEAMTKGIEEVTRHGLEEKRPILITADLLSIVDYLPSFDVIWAYSVLFHMEEPVIEDTFHFISEHLEEGGRFYANVEAGEWKEEGWLDFPVIQRPLAWYEDRAADQGLRVRDLGSLKELGQDSGLERDDQQRMLEFARR